MIMIMITIIIMVIIIFIIILNVTVTAISITIILLLVRFWTALLGMGEPAPQHRSHHLPDDQLAGQDDDQGVVILSVVMGDKESRRTMALESNEAFCPDESDLAAAGGPLISLQKCRCLCIVYCLYCANNLIWVCLLALFSADSLHCW